MKKFLLLFFMLLSFTVGATAQIQTYKSTKYAFANVYSGTYVWGDWQYSNLTITLNLTSDIITVYSAKTQKYKVYDYTEAYTDNSGGVQVKYYVIDQDGDRGNVRLRKQSDGTLQIYVDFNDCAWCYCVRRVS